MRFQFLVLATGLLSIPSYASAVSCQITGSGFYNNPPGVHVDYLCRLDAQEVATLSHPDTRGAIAAVLSRLPPGGPVLAVYVDQRIQQIQNGSGPNGAQIKATLANNNFLREFLVDPL